jgi:L-alanine-DL-glutamate epimerase-like enolase superfamily enzyme
MANEASTLAKKQETLEKALERNPDWAEQPIPSDVLDSLR